jgi:hypothetical protein
MVVFARREVDVEGVRGARLVDFFRREGEGSAS